MILFMLLVSCQTFGLKRPLPKPLGAFQTIDTGRYLISADLLSSEESKEYFGIDLPRMGIQILNIAIENKAASPLKLNLADIFIRDQDKYLYRPLPLRQLAKKIYKANRYKEMVNYGAKRGTVYGIGGAIIGAVTNTILGKSPATGAAIGGWSLGSIKAIEGAEQAKHKAPERIKDELGTLMMVPGSIPQDTRVRGLLFFEIEPQDIRSLEIRLVERESRERLDLDLEIVNNLKD